MIAKTLALHPSPKDAWHLTQSAVRCPCHIPSLETYRFRLRFNGHAEHEEGEFDGEDEDDDHEVDDPDFDDDEHDYEEDEMSDDDDVCS